MKHLIFIYDYTCPYCYVMFSEMKRLKAKYAVKIYWVPIEIFTQVPQQGIALASIFSPRKLKKTQALIENIAHEKNIPFYQPKQLYNTRIANLLTAYAGRKRNTTEVVEALFNNVFVYNKNIGDLETIRKICIAVDIDFEKFESEMHKGLLDEINKGWKDQFQEKEFQVVPMMITMENTLIQGVCSFEELVKMIE
ncbi:DsbA family protein [Clostridiaceae bacterium 35-E11]